MDLDPSTLQHIVETDLIGKANLLALVHGAAVCEHGRTMLRCSMFTQRTPETDGPLTDDPLGKAVTATVLQIKRCDWDGDAIIEIKEDGHVRFAAIPVPYRKDPTGSCITSGGRRYQIEEYVPGSWLTGVQRAYDARTR